MRVEDLALSDEKGRIVQRFPHAGLVAGKDGSQKQCCFKTLGFIEKAMKRLFCLENEGPVFEQVKGRVAREGKLGKDSQRGASLHTMAGSLEDLCKVPVEIANGGVDLVK